MFVMFAHLLCVCRQHDVAESGSRPAESGGGGGPASEPGPTGRRPVPGLAQGPGRSLHRRRGLQAVRVERPRWIPQELELSGLLQGPVVPADR